MIIQILNHSNNEDENIEADEEESEQHNIDYIKKMEEN